MATKTRIQAPNEEIQRHPFFATTPIPEGVFISEIPVFLQANCAQNGSWVLGEKSLGNDPIEFYILAFQYSMERDPYRNAEVQNANIQIGTIYFVPIDESLLRPNLVYATKIKNQASGRKGSLSNFASRVAEIVVSGYDPREVIWEAKFIQKSGSLPDGTAYKCAVLDFDYRFPTQASEAKLLDDCVLVLKDDLKLKALQSASLPAIAELPEASET
jgi:hypothetical protein